MSNHAHEPFDPFVAGELEFVGPIEYHAVVLHGRKVPRLTATPKAGGAISLLLDDRFGIDVSLSDAQWLVPFMANCLAVGMGYSGFPEVGQEPQPAVHMPKMTAISFDE